ncbi:methyltransferase domain-containing protein, partial [Bartonella sp. CL63NXGY]|uniref:methyltransferase domain-containing protein n=1 Tax=Bartonella sp. CL63NXGY TaxID=3243538 RepID=UPI0035CFDF42
MADLGLNYAGLFVLIAKQLAAPGKVKGVNIGPASIAKREQERIVENRVADRAEIVDGDLINLPLASRSFDYVLSSFAFHGVKPAINRGRAIQEAARIL